MVVVVVARLYVQVRVPIHVREAQSQQDVMIVLQRVTILAMALLLPHPVHLVVTVAIWLVRNHVTIRAEPPVLTPV